jgi:hypothetical protein
MQFLHHLPHKRRPVEMAGTSNIKSALHLQTTMDKARANGRCKVQIAQY